MAPSNSPTHRLAQWPKGESETFRCRSNVEDRLQSRLPELVELFYFVQPPLGATASCRWFKTGHLWFMWYWPCIIQQSKLLCHLTELFAVYEKKRFQVFDVEKFCWWQEAVLWYIFTHFANSTLQNLHFFTIFGRKYKINSLSLQRFLKKKQSFFIQYFV